MLLLKEEMQFLIPATITVGEADIYFGSPPEQYSPISRYKEVPAFILPATKEVSLKVWAITGDSGSTMLNNNTSLENLIPASLKGER